MNRVHLCPGLFVGRFEAHDPFSGRGEQFCGYSTAEMGYAFPIEHSPRFLTPYEYQAAHAEVVNRWAIRAPASMRRGLPVREIRRDQARKARERRARIFAEHDWVEVPNAHPGSDEGLATQPVEAGFSVASSNEMFLEERR